MGVVFEPFHLHGNHRVYYREETTIPGVGSTTSRGMPDVVFEQEMSNGKLELVGGEETTGAYVPARAKEEKV